MKLNLEWKFLDSDHVALVFDKPTWQIFQSAADARGMETTDMIAEAVAASLGPILAKRTQN